MCRTTEKKSLVQCRLKRLEDQRSTIKTFPRYQANHSRRLDNCRLSITNTELSPSPLSRTSRPVLFSLSLALYFPHHAIFSDVFRAQKQSTLTAEDREKLDELDKNMIKRKAQLYEIEQSLPQKNSMYLKVKSFFFPSFPSNFLIPSPLQIILGNVNVSILNRAEKVRYKDDYEKFKFILNCIGLFMSCLNLLMNYRALELAFMFLLVWYYCTLTIRESILKVNGSRIKGWWRLHHFISTVCAAVLLIWPQGEAWQSFRTQFMCFNVYISEFCGEMCRYFWIIPAFLPRPHSIPSVRLPERCSVSA